MEVSLTDAKAQLTELVRLAEAGNEVVLTRHGKAAVRLVPVQHVVDRATRIELLNEIRKAGSERVAAGASAARSQDFLFDDDGDRAQRT